jgi:hypothetical protein
VKPPEITNFCLVDFNPSDIDHFNDCLGVGWFIIISYLEVYMDQRIMTLHPETGKKGVNIRRDKYDVIRSSILDNMQTYGTMTFRDLMDAVQTSLSGSFEGSISWYVTTVKLDLEARGLIERIPGQSPQKIRLTMQQ